MAVGIPVILEIAESANTSHIVERRSDDVITINGQGD